MDYYTISALIDLIGSENVISRNRMDRTCTDGLDQADVLVLEQDRRRATIHRAVGSRGAEGTIYYRLYDRKGLIAVLHNPTPDTLSELNWKVEHFKAHPNPQESNSANRDEPGSIFDRYY